MTMGTRKPKILSTIGARRVMMSSRRAVMSSRIAVMCRSRILLLTLAVMPRFGSSVLKRLPNVHSTGASRGISLLIFVSCVLSMYLVRVV